MTAFARVECNVENRHLVWELRSVNHRYLETTFRLPDGLRQTEPSVRDFARKHLKRGKLDGSLRVEMISAAPQVEINRDVLRQLLSALDQVRHDAPDIGSVSPMDLLRWPGVLDDTPADDQAIIAAASELFVEGLEQLLESRSREGEQLKQIISERLAQIDEVIEGLKPLTENLAQLQKEKVLQKVADLDVNVDPSRLEQEVALLAQKVDVTEEIDRLSIHVDEARSCAMGPGPHGRRLDFLTQELNREANTLGAKSVTPDTSQKAVDLKVVVEQIREQVQNIE
jgi:uncharacterized protein (TIGR00255 family)